MTSAEPSYPATDTCLLRVVPPLGLAIIQPTVQNGSVYLQPNDTRILLRVQSRYLTTVTWCGTNRSVAFLPNCPLVWSRPEFCQPGPNTGSWGEATEPTQYAVLDRSGPWDGGPGESGAGAGGPQ